MADFTAGFETGVNGNNIKSTDPGDATPWAAGSPDTAEFIYDNAHVNSGSLAAKVIYTGTPIRPFWDLTSVTDHYGRFYLYVESLPATPCSIMEAEDSGAGRDIRMDIRDTGKLRLINASAGTDISTTASISLNQWIRVEWHFIHNVATGVMEAKLFNTATSSSPTETLTSGACDTGAACRFMVFGEMGAGATITYWMDDVVANATSYPGPIPQVVSTANLAPVIYGRGAC